MTTEQGAPKVDAGGYMTMAGIDAVDDIRFEDVPVPEWGDNAKVRIRTLPATELDAFQASLLVGSGKNQKISTANIRAKLASLAIVDHEGKPIATLRDVERLGKKSSAAMNRVYERVQKLNRMTDEDVEELAKNSGSVPPDSLSLDSP